jgi:hypothetical protein
MTDSQQPPTYPPAQQPPAQQFAPAPEQKPARNVLALIALIVSIVGFIFACIPGALILGWILLPIAFILSIVSLFMKGRGKGLGIAGLIVSVVGTIVAIIVFVTVVAVSFNDAFGDETTVIEEAPAASAAPGESPVEESPAQSEAGTRDAPVALGAAITSEDWTVVVNSVNRDGTAAVADGNQFNDAAPAGSHYEIVNYTVTYNGADSAYAAFVGVDMVTTSGNVVDSFSNPVVLADSFGLDELFAGASATGSAAYLIPDGDAALVRVRPGMVADEIFVQP